MSGQPQPRRQGETSREHREARCPSPTPITMTSPPPAAGKLTVRLSPRARGLARITTLALCISILGAFTAQAAFAEETLPDGRVYEMVTPVNNDGANVYVPEAFAAPNVSQGIETEFPFQVSPDGTAVVYQGDATIGGQGEIGKGLGDQYLAKRSASGGWTQSVIQPAAARKTRFQGFSNDLSVGVLSSGAFAEPNIPPLSPFAPGKGYAVLYARTGSCTSSVEPCQVPSEEEEEEEARLYRPLFTNEVNFKRSAGGFGSNEVFNEGKNNNRVSSTPVFAGGSSDFGDLLFEANDDLLSGTSPLAEELSELVEHEVANNEDNNYLYDSANGQLGLVDVLPDGKIAGNATFGALPFANKPKRNGPDFGGVVSGGGRWVYWTDASESSGVVYVRVDGTSTLKVSEGAARYWASGDEGRYAFYVENEQLFRFDAEADTREALTPATGGVQGVLGVSEDGESEYFVAHAILGSTGSAQGALPVEGESNLYLLNHGDSTPVFIATLSPEDGNEVNPFTGAFGSTSGQEYGDWQPSLGSRTAGVAGGVVSGGGGGLVFMSDRGLPAVGFPGGFVSNGSDEVYMYEPGVNRLFCVSCVSSGEPGNGQVAGFLPVSWLDVELPSWTADDGNRVFFDSEVPLVAQDTDGVQDVYEWEREGVGGCVVGSGVNGGCVFLLSGGTGEANSWFIGASASGDDVFIASRTQLVPEDQNDAFDLYDVRVGGVKRVSAPLCTGTGCQGVPGAPPVFATPASSTFSGVGNFPAPVPVKPESKPKVKKKPAKCKKGVRHECKKKPGAKNAKKSTWRAK